MYLKSGKKEECFGCEGCVQACPKEAIRMEEDGEGFRYPVVDPEKCIECGLCEKVCPHARLPGKNESEKYVFGGYSKDQSVRFESTSGGAFSAIAEAFCDENYVCFGAAARGLSVYHDCITDKRQLSGFRKSKYAQSEIGSAYRDVRRFLTEGKKVLFSGTPCQIAGLVSYLSIKNTDRSGLLTVEVICEGIPSPLYIRKLEKKIKKKNGDAIESLDYRYTGKSLFSHGKWDFEEMKIELADRKKTLIRDRWFNPFWSVWLQHLMSRPSCYECPFATRDRVADITLGDLWGVHLYCPELYGNNGGSSLVVCNSEKGKDVFKRAQELMFGHELAFEDALKYQSPMKKTIAKNPERTACMADLQSDMSYDEFNRKWAKRPTPKLLIQKYLWGNRQKICAWNIKQKLKGKGKEYA